jgi:hypothetical protein
MKVHLLNSDYILLRTSDTILSKIVLMFIMIWSDHLEFTRAGIAAQDLVLLTLFCRVPIFLLPF